LIETTKSYPTTIGPRFLRFSNDISRLSIVDLFSPMGLADALAALDWTLWMESVRPSELLDLAWTNQTLKSKHPDVGGAAHTQRLIQSTNHFVAWVGRDIIRRSMTSMDEGCDRIAYFIAVARQAFKINSFNTVFLIVTALGLPAVRLLHTAWGKLRASFSRLLAALKSFCNATHNYAAYRRVFMEVIDKGQPCIPVFQVAIKDVAFVQGAGPWTVDGIGNRGEERIDMRKVISVCKRIDTLLGRRERVAIDTVQPGQKTVPRDVTGRSYVVIIDEADTNEVLDLVNMNETTSDSLIVSMNKREHDPDTETIGMDDINQDVTLPSIVPSFLSVQALFTSSIFSLLPGVAREAVRSPYVVVTPRAKNNVGQVDLGSSLVTPKKPGPAKQLFPNDCTNNTDQKSQSQNKRSHLRQSVKKEWRDPQRFTIRCSELLLSLLLAAVESTPTNFSDLHILARRANEIEATRKARLGRKMSDEALAATAEPEGEGGEQKI